MKKVVKRLLFLLLILLLLEFIFYLFKTKHNINYVLVNNDEKINVTEKFQLNNYYFEVKYNDHKFKFSYENKFSKTKKVLNKIETYTDGEMFCIYPIFNNDKQLNIICNLDNVQYHYNYLSNDLVDFVKILQDKGYSNSSWDNNSKTKSLGTGLVYSDNIPNNSYIYVWKYNGFYTLNGKEQSELNIFNNDTYINKLGIRVDKYYVIPNYNEQYNYSQIFIYDMTTNKQKILNLKNKITNDYYNNGVVDNKLYIFDLDNLTQYKINPKRVKIEKVGDKKSGGLYYDSDWSIKNIYDFKREEIKFNKNITVPENISNYIEIFNYKDNYYYIDDNSNIIYYNLTNNFKTYLLNLSNVKSVSLVENELYFIYEDSLYTFNILNGLKKIITYSELSFNPNNRYVVYKK